MYPDVVMDCVRRVIVMVVGIIALITAIEYEKEAFKVTDYHWDSDRHGLAIAGRNTLKPPWVAEIWSNCEISAEFDVVVFGEPIWVAGSQAFIPFDTKLGQGAPSLKSCAFEITYRKL